MTDTMTINRDDARAALADAMADLCHVFAVDGVDGSMKPTNDELVAALSVEVANAMPTALEHFRGEQAGDGITREVVG